MYSAACRLSGRYKESQLQPQHNKISDWSPWEARCPCASRKDGRRQYFNCAVCLGDTKCVIQTNRLLFWAYHHLLCAKGCQFSKQL